MMNDRRRRGFGQVEVVVSTIIVGVLMVSCFSTIAASMRSQNYESNKARGLVIAESLMAEITQMPMREPSCDCGFGTESGESGTDRLDFDDVDDYDDLVESPPKSRDGTLYAGYSNLSTKVTVEMMSSTNWGVTSASYDGVYRVTVSVLHGTLEVCRIVGYRTSGSLGSGYATNGTGPVSPSSAGYSVFGIGNPTTAAATGSGTTSSSTKTAATGSGTTSGSTSTTSKTSTTTSGTTTGKKK